MPTKYTVKANNKGHSFELVELASIREKKPNELSTFELYRSKDQYRIRSKSWRAL